MRLPSVPTRHRPLPLHDCGWRDRAAWGLRHADETVTRTYLFVRKNKDDEECSKEFYFMGEMRADPQGFREFVMQPANKPAVEIRYVLDTAVKEEPYDYITQPLE